MIAIGSIDRLHIQLIRVDDLEDNDVAWFLNNWLINQLIDVINVVEKYIKDENNDYHDVQSLCQSIIQNYIKD